MLLNKCEEQVTEDLTEHQIKPNQHKIQLNKRDGPHVITYRGSVLSSVKCIPLT